MEKIHIYHTNDIHSHLQSWPRTRAFLQQRRSEHEKNGEACFIFDLGDFIDRSDLYTEGTLGRGNISLLNDANYDAITIGNNEGITLSKEALNVLYTGATFDVVLSNLKNEDGTQPDWALPTQIYATQSGIKIGIIAATAPFADYYTPLGWKILEPVKNLQEMTKQLEGNVDILICLSHLGLKTDQEIAEKIPSIDLIIGAHTHHVLEEGQRVNHSLLTGGGKYGVYIGYSTIDYELQNESVSAVQTTLIETTYLPAIEGEVREIEALHQLGKEYLDVELFHSSLYYNREWYHDSHLARLFAKAILNYSTADCAFFNAGIFLTPLEKGAVTAYDLHKMLPHPINLCEIEMTGAQLKSCLATIEEQRDWERIEVKGLGFRGKVLGKMLTYQCKITDGELYVNNKWTSEKDKVRVVTLDMFTFGWFFPEIKNMKKTYLLPYFLRDILTIYGYKVFRK